MKRKDNKSMGRPKKVKVPVTAPEATPAPVDHEANTAAQAQTKAHLQALHKELVDLGIHNISNLEVMISRL